MHCSWTQTQNPPLYRFRGTDVDLRREEGDREEIPIREQQLEGNWIRRLDDLVFLSPVLNQTQPSPYCALQSDLQPNKAVYIVFLQGASSVTTFCLHWGEAHQRLHGQGAPGWSLTKCHLMSVTISIVWAFCRSQCGYCHGGREKKREAGRDRKTDRGSGTENKPKKHFFPHRILFFADFCEVLLRRGEKRPFSFPNQCMKVLWSQESFPVAGVFGTNTILWCTKAMQTTRFDFFNQFFRLFDSFFDTNFEETSEVLRQCVLSTFLVQ